MSSVGTMFVSVLKVDPWFMLYLSKIYVYNNEDVYLVINYDCNNKKFTFGIYIIPKFYDTKTQIVLYV